MSAIPQVYMWYVCPG